jgi:hypothetical protein
LPAIFYTTGPNKGIKIHALNRDTPNTKKILPCQGEMSGFTGQRGLGEGSKGLKFGENNERGKFQAEQSSTNGISNHHSKMGILFPIRTQTAKKTREKYFFARMFASLSKLINHLYPLRKDNKTVVYSPRPEKSRNYNSELNAPKRKRSA